MIDLLEQLFKDIEEAPKKHWELNERMFLHTRAVETSGKEVTVDIMKEVITPDEENMINSNIDTFIVLFRQRKEVEELFSV